MQPHQFSYCSCLHLSKTENFTPDSQGPWIQSVRTWARSKTQFHPNQTHPLRLVGLPLAKLSLAVKVQVVGLGGPAPAPSTPESGIPSLSPSALCDRPRFLSGSPPLVLPRPQKTRNQVGKNCPTPRTQVPQKGSF